MSRLWDRLFGRRPDRQPARGLPRTFEATPAGAGRPQVFDPSLAHYRSAFRRGDPTAFPDRASAMVWADLRRQATDHVLRCVAESDWGDRLILRGSRSMKAWVGDAAREPGDLDFVAARPASLPESYVVFQFADLVFERPGPVGVVWDAQAVAADDIWTYERVPGRRLVFPWSVPGLPGGAVQVDVAFGEQLAEPDRREAIPAADGGCIWVRTAGPAQALAWKLVWLASDRHPQGKDLYDAVLLAEHIRLPAAVLDATFRQARLPPPGSLRFVNEWAGQVDWPNFRLESSWVDGELEEWLVRLEAALAPTFAGEEPPPKPDDFPSAWRTPTVVGLAETVRQERAFDRLPILADALEEAGCDWIVMPNHLRAGGPHAGGCWAVERVLGAGG